MDHCACGKLVPLWSLEGFWSPLPATDRCTAPACGHAGAGGGSLGATSSVEAPPGARASAAAREAPATSERLSAWTEDWLSTGMTIGMVLTGLFVLVAAALQYVS